MWGNGREICGGMAGRHVGEWQVNMWGNGRETCG